MSSEYLYNNSSGFNGYQYYTQQKNVTPNFQQQPFVVVFDDSTVVETDGSSNIPTPMIWIGDSSYNLSSYDLVEDKNLVLYTRHSVKPYWRLKQTNSGGSKKDLASYMSSLDQKLPLINGFIPFDLVENNIGDDLVGQNNFSVFNDIVSLNLGIVTITDGCNVNFSDRKGTIINTMNPITHPYLMYSPNIINNSVGKCRLNCVSKVKKMPNVVVIGGYNMNQLVYVDIIANKILNRFEYTTLKDVTMIKTSSTMNHIRDDMLFVFYDSQFIDFIDPITNTLIYSFTLQITTNCQNDTIYTFDVNNGSLVILTNNAVIVFDYQKFKLVNEIIIVSNNELTKPTHISIHPVSSNLLLISSKKQGKIGLLDLLDYKSLVSFLSIDKIYNLQASSNMPIDFVGFTPVGDRIVAIKNILDTNKEIKSYLVPGFQLDSLTLFNYNANKVFLERATTTGLESAPFNGCLNSAVSEYTFNVDSLNGLNCLDAFSTSFEANDSLQMIDFLSKAEQLTSIPGNDSTQDIYSSLQYKDLLLKGEQESLKPAHYKNYKYKILSLKNDEDDLCVLASSVVSNTIPKKHNNSIPSELLLPFISEEKYADFNKTIPLDTDDNGPPLIYRKLDIPIANSNESSGNSLLSTNNKDLFLSKIYSKYNDTIYCGLYPLLDENLEGRDNKINLNAILQFVVYNSRLYSMIKNFLSEVPWQGTPLLIHEFGYFIDGLYGNRIYDNRILLNFLDTILPKNDCNTILQVYQFIDSFLTKEYQQYYKQASSNKKKHITGYITNAATGKKKAASGSGSANNAALGKYQKNVTNHLDVLLSKEFQYAKSNHNNITTESLTILAYMTDKEFKEVLSRNNNWLLAEFEVSISKISPQLFFKVDENEVIPKYCSSPKKYYLTSVVFNVDGPQKNQVTCIKFETGWYLFNDHLVLKIAEKEVLNLANKLPMLFTYTLQPFAELESISAHIDVDMLKSESLKFFDYHVEPNSNVAMDSEYVIENYKRQEITPNGSVKIIKQEVKVLARLTVIQRIINENQKEDIKIIFDDYISHDKPIEDYLTKFSGILPNDLTIQKSTKKLHDRQETYRKFWILVKLNCKIIGHGLKSDFEGIVINVPKDQIVDTAVIYWIGGRLLSLKFLYYKVFDKIIQGENHDSYEDSYAAMVLYEKYLDIIETGEANWDKFLDNIFEEGRRCNYKVGNS